MAVTVGAPLVYAASSRNCTSASTSTCSCSRLSLPRRVVFRSSLINASLRSGFFDGGGRLAELSASLRAYNSRHGGGALAAQANVFERVVRIFRSYVNSVISAAEDPEKLIEQTVIEMNEDLIKMRQASAQVLASQKQLESKYKQAEDNSQSWYKRARLALEKGDEVLAREALKRRKDYEDNAKALKAQLEQQKSVVDKLLSNTRLLESKIQEAKSKKDTLKARAQSAKTSQKVNEMLGNINTSSALAAFEKMEEKVTALEAEADSLNQLNTDELAGKFALLESNDVDDDLASLKSEMLGSSKKQKPGELPAGRSAVASSSSSNPFADAEIEKELNELRRKTREM